MFAPGNWDTATFFGNYLPIGLFTIFLIFFKVKDRTRFVRASEMDLTTGVHEFEEQHRLAEEERAMLKANKPTKKWYQYIIG